MGVAARLVLAEAGRRSRGPRQPSSPLNQSERNARLHHNPNAELYPYYGATGQVGEIDGYLADGEYVLLGEDGAPFLDQDKNKAYLVAGRFWANNHAHVLRAGNMFGNRWLLHWLNTVDYRGIVNGTTRLKLTQGAMNEMPVPVPLAGHEDQIIARIDELFTEVDDGEAALERARGDLATWRKALLKAAVTGELTADWRVANPPTETGADLLARILAERRTRWLAEARNKGKRYTEPAVPTTLSRPHLPEGWCWATLEQLSWDSGYGTSVKCSAADEGMPVLRIPNVRGGRISLGDLKRTTAPLDLRPAAYLSMGDLLVVRTNGSEDLIGRAALVLERPVEDTYFASYLIRLRLLGPDDLLVWLSVLVDSPIFRAAVLRSIGSSAGQYNLNLTKIEGFALPIPPLTEIKAALNRFQSAAAEASFGDELVETSKGLSATLRQSILAAAFRGDLVA